MLSIIIDAHVLVVGSPTCKSGYPGLFKHVIDLIDPVALRGKPVQTTGRGYATDEDFVDGLPRSEVILNAVAQAVAAVGRMLPLREAGQIRIGIGSRQKRIS